MESQETDFILDYTAEQANDALGCIINGDIDDAADRAEAAAEKAEQAAVKTPYIGENNTWMVWDFQANEYVDTEISALGKQGEVGPPGPQGGNGAIVDLETGIFAMSVSSEGHLIVSVNVEEEIPPLEINEQGHLIYKITS